MMKHVVFQDKTILCFIGLMICLLVSGGGSYAADVQHVYDDLGRLALTQYTDGYIMYAIDYDYDDAGNMMMYARSQQVMDTDGDQIPDAWETEYGLDPENPDDAAEDLDQDGLTNREEYQAGTDPTLADTDGDGFFDGDEAAAGTDPLDPGSHPIPAPVPAVSFLTGVMFCGALMGFGFLSLRRRPLTAGLMVLLFLIPLWSSHVFADCSCSIGNNGIYVIGTEYIATGCPADPPSDTQNYTYIKYSVRCINNNYITNYRFRGDTVTSPASLAQSYVNQGYRILRNEVGTHIYAVHPDFKGDISGKNFNGLSAGVYTADIDGYCCQLSGNTYACSSSLPDDTDGDGYSVCSDCDDTDAAINPSVDQDGDGVNACDDCNDNDPEKTTGDSCYSELPPDTGYGPGTGNGGSGGSGGGPGNGPGGGAGPGGNGGPGPNNGPPTDGEGLPEQQGEPITITNGNMYDYRTDLVFPSPHGHGLVFKRFYNSRSGEAGAIGYGWTHSYATTLTTGVLLDGKEHIRITDKTGQGRYFAEGEAGRWDGVFKDVTYVTAETDGTYTWNHPDGTVHYFDSGGDLTAVDDALGNRQSLAYDTYFRLSTVTDEASGRVLTFHYNGDNRIETIEGPVTPSVPDGIQVVYGYDVLGNLTSVTYADGSGLSYDYSDPNDSHNLTAKKDKENHLLTSWTYDSQDRAISSTGKIPEQSVTIAYVDDTTVKVTDAYGIVRVYALAFYDNLFPKVTQVVTENCSACMGHLPVRYVYDTDFNVLEKEYADGSVTVYGDYDLRGNPGTITRASGTGDEQTVTYTYHPVLNTLLTQVEASVLGAGNTVTTWDYDNDGNATANENPTRLVYRKIQTGYTKNEAGETVPYEYITTYTYNGKGQLTSEDGILPGSSDITTYTYDPVTGDLLTLTRPLVGAATFGGYDGAGNPAYVIDVNGHQTDFSYDGKNRLLTATRSGLSTARTYTVSGKPHTVTDTGNRTLTYTYDGAYGRLSRITDDLGHSLFYGYNSQGDKIEDSAYDSTNTRPGGTASIISIRSSPACSGK